MPTYEYECNECQNKFELFQSIKSEPVAECPQCGSDSKRLFSMGGGIIFKGSGFYTTDYKKDNAAGKKNEASACSNADSSSEKCNSCPAAE